MLTETPGLGGDSSGVRNPVGEGAYHKEYDEKLKPETEEAQEEPGKKRAELMKTIRVFEERIKEQRGNIAHWQALLSGGARFTHAGSSAETQDIQQLIDKAAKDIEFVESQVADSRRTLSEMGN